MFFKNIDGNVGADGDPNTNDGGGGGGGEAGGSTIFCSSGYDGGSPNGSTGGAGSGSNASKGGDGGKGGNGGGSNSYYSTTTGSSYRYYGSYSASGTNDGAGKIEIRLIKYAPCKLDTCTFDETNLIDIGKVRSKCTGLAEHAHWNGTGEIEQTWNASQSKWLPSAEGGWGSSTSACYFQCDSGYEWSDYYGTWRCINIKTNVACPMLPANAEYNTVDHVTQTYNGSAWTPSADSISYSETPTTSECRFKCQTGYTWDGGQCRNTRTVSCPALPTGAVYNTASSITQNWTPANNWQPANTLTYNTTASSAYCRYKCNTNYTWSSSEQRCKADSHSADCTGLIENAVWNTVSSITQTWNGSEWRPSPVGHYNTSASQTECRYKCKSGFHTENSGETCVSNERDVNCASLPSHAHWSSGGTGTKTIHQTWGSSWSPSTSVSNNSSTDANQCYFQCNTNYEWNGSSCVAKTQPADCTGLPENAVWNTASSITQTWNENGSGCDGTNCWYPTTAGSYSTTASTSECRFKCKDGNKWNGSACMTTTFTWGFESDMPTSGSNWVIQSGNIIKNWNSSTTSSPGWSRSSSLGSGLPGPKGSWSMCAVNQNQHYTHADITVKVTVPDYFSSGTFSFYYTGSSEVNYDFLMVYVDPSGTPADSGNACDSAAKLCTRGSNYTSWTNQAVTLSPGTHTLLFRYRKDSSANSNADQFCIDDLLLVDNEAINETANFESSTYSTSHITVTGSGSYPWTRQQSSQNGNIGANGGSYSMCSSNNAVANSTSTMKVTVNMPRAGTASFYLKGGSESTSYDYLTFMLDGTQQLKTASVSSWTKYSYSLTAGNHEFTFNYQKDGSVDTAPDKYCIDDFNITIN